MVNRRYLVAGAGGFIGGHLVRSLLEKGDVDVVAVDCKPLNEWEQLFNGATNVVADLREADACRNVVSDVSHVVNLAADMGGMGFIESHKADCMLSVLINTNLLWAARDQDVERYFYASSACVYNADRQSSPYATALKEEDAYPADPEDGYGWEKLFSERMCRHFLEDYGVETRVARFHNVYGPNGTWRGGREKAPAAICRKVAEAAERGGGEIVIWGDGQQTRSFTYIDDCIDGIIRITDSEIRTPVNLGSSELVSIDELVSIVEAIAGVECKRQYDTSAPQGVRGRNSDNSYIFRQLNWEPRTSLKDGLLTTYSWIRQELLGTADR